MKNFEDLIWDSITNSAKKKNDFASFKKDYPLDADMILFKIIVDFAIKKDLEIIANEIHAQLLMTGFMWKMEEIIDFLNGNKEFLKLEISVAKLASDMLQTGSDPVSVYKSMQLLLEN
jgi:hypothetical protein